VKQAQGFAAQVPAQTLGVDDTKSNLEREPQARREKVIRIREFIMIILFEIICHRSLLDIASARSFSVLGDDRGAGRFPALPSGERLLEAIARAGGLTYPGNESWVVFERGKRRVVIPSGAILVFGASGRQGQFAFEAWRFSGSGCQG
jgi:hypothetical protein